MRPALPDGYRLVAVASDKWVLVAPGGSWVASYRGGLDLWSAVLDAGGHDLLLLLARASEEV